MEVNMRNISGTPYHLEALHKREDDERRHVTRCRHRDNKARYCNALHRSCYSSRFCDAYLEKSEEQEDLFYQAPKDPSPVAVKAKTSQETPLKAPVRVGDVWTHKKYGPGKIRAIHGGKEVSIAFKEGEVKKFTLEALANEKFFKR